MRSFYAQFWPAHTSASLRKAIIVSIVLHVLIVAGLTVRFPQRLQLTQAGSYSVELLDPAAPPSEAPLGKPMVAPPVEPPKPEPAPPPSPKKEERKPEPKKEEPKPEPKKEEPKKETPKPKPK